MIYSPDIEISNFWLANSTWGGFQVTFLFPEQLGGGGLLNFLLHTYIVSNQTLLRLVQNTP